MLVIGVSGHELTARERDWLQHDACAGVILFLRNFASKAQVMELTQSIREAAPRPMLLCVDQEGGRVQRFRDGYSKLPPLEGFDALYRRDADAALELAREHAWLMASGMPRPGSTSASRRWWTWRAATAPWQPRVLAGSAGGRGIHPRLRRRHARCRHGRDAQAFPRPRLGAGRTPISRSPSMTVRWTSCAGSTWCRSRPASTRARKR